MNLSFLATIAFALLALFMAFTANLVAMIFTASQWHVSGVVLAVVTAASSYWAQHYFTQAAMYQVTIEQAHEPLAAALQAMTEEAKRTQQCGVTFQLVAIACLTASVVCFWAGMR